MKSKKPIKKNSTKTKATEIQNKSTVISFPENHLISKTIGSAMITKLNGELATKAIPFEMPLAINFNRNIFDLILKDETCEGIRFYYGLNEYNQLSLVITGIDTKMNDIYLPIILDGETVTKNLGVGDMGQVCPLYPGEIIQLP